MTVWNSPSDVRSRSIIWRHLLPRRLRDDARMIPVMLLRVLYRLALCVLSREVGDMAGIRLHNPNGRSALNADDEGVQGIILGLKGNFEYFPDF